MAGSLWEWGDPDVVGGLDPGEVPGPIEDADPAAWGEGQVADGEVVGEVVRQDDGEDGAVLLGVADLVAVGGGGRGGRPRSGGVDAGAAGSDVDEQVAAVGDDIGEQVDELGAGEGVGGGLLGVVPEGSAQAAGQLPGSGGRRAGGGVLVGVEVGVDALSLLGQRPARSGQRLERQGDEPQVQLADQAVRSSG